MPSLLSAEMSKLLPTVKCSNCNRPVPLDDLSDHVCATAPTLPEHVLSPAAVVSLLPQHLFADPTSNNERHLGGQDWLRINTGHARNGNDRAPLPYQRSLLSPSPAPSTSSLSTSPLRARAGTIAGTTSVRPSNASATSYNSPPPASSPATPRPSFFFSRDAGPSYSSGPPSRQPPSSPHQISVLAPVPQYPELNTQTGGEAGMAGVGRRGFATATRVATFTMPGDQLLGPQPRRNNATIDTDLLRCGKYLSHHRPGMIN